jgi:hypothetical protein
MRNLFLICSNVSKGLVNTILFYTVEPLWGSRWRCDAFSPDCTYGLSGVIHIKPRRGMLLMYATGGVNCQITNSQFKLITLSNYLFSINSLILGLCTSATFFIL